MQPRTSDLLTAEGDKFSLQATSAPLNTNLSMAR